MAPIPNPQVLYDKIPTQYPLPGEHLIYQPDSETIDLENVPLDGGVLVKTLYASIDPYMRGRMRDPKVPSYSSPFELHKPGTGGLMVKVLRSESSKYKAGDHLITYAAEWRAYQVLSEDEAGRIVNNPYNLPWITFLGAAGGTARTAFYALRVFGKLKAGETIFISTAAGAVGSVAVQLAKLQGLKVIGSTGDDQKLPYLRELGVDVAFNYKKQSVWDVLKENGPINVYFDNVGGEQLDAALVNAAPTKARFIMCGYASEYNGEEPYGVKHMDQVLKKRISMNGFLVGELVAEYGEDAWVNEYLPLIRDGKINFRIEEVHGLENLAAGLLKILKGENNGKGIVVVAED
ncbi:alcohol dehydrogenase [Clavulina sp. PMI_390]|nr:alcohol dehydrogenase [Clavulina sp. PMI_390]